MRQYAQCLVSTPAFIAQQLGHSVQMLSSTYARKINSSNVWQEPKKLQIGPKLVRSCEEAT
jgi:integrase